MKKKSNNIFKNKIVVYSCITILSFVLYGGTISHDFSLDDNYITDNLPADNKLFESFDQNFDRVDYRPIPMVTFSIQKALEGEIRPSTSHFLNIVFYILGIIAFYHLILLLFKEQDKRYLLALCIVLIFVAHPIHSNVVSSIKNRDILLSFLFAILGFSAFIRYLNFTKKRQLIYCSIFTLLALISKLDAIWVIMMIPIYYFIVGGQINYKLVIRTAKIVAFAFAILIFRFMMSADADPYVDVNPILFTENPMVGSGIKGLIFYPIVSFFYYIKFLIIPFGYYFYFGFETIPNIHFLHPYFIVGLALFILFIYALFYTFKHKKGVFLQLIFFATSIFFFVNILKPIAGVVAPRLIYHASAPFCVLLVLGFYKMVQSDYIHSLFDPFKKLKQLDNKLLFVTFILVLFYLPFTISRNMDWKNHISLMDADIPNLKHSFQANRIASANYLRLAENPANFKTNDERMAIVRKGLNASKNAAKIDPESIYTQEGIGIAERILGNNKNALEQFKLVIEKFDTSEVAWDFSGDIFRENNNLEAALFHYKNAVRVSPLNLELYQKLNQTAFAANEIEDALQFYQLMANDNPNWYLPYENMGYLNLYSQDSLDAALQFKNCFERGRKLAPIYQLLANYLATNNYTAELEIFNAAYYK